MKKISQKTARKTGVQTAEKGRSAPSAAGNGEDAAPKPHGSGLRAERPESVSTVIKKARTRGKKPARIGDALRQRGFDEHTIADHYVDVAHRLKGKSDTSGSVEKLLIDVLKECSKYLEPRPLERADERSGTAVHVHLVHNVPRPARDACDRSVNAKRDS
jgi:hypothetical protein